MDDIKEVRDEQDTGNHATPGDAAAHGADRFGGSRAGAENVEPATINKSTDVDKVPPLEQQKSDDARNPSGPTLRQAERDEHGRL